MKFDWLTTTAVVAVLGSGVALAQAQEPQKQREHALPRAEQGATKQPNAQPGRQGEQRAEQQRPPEPSRQPAQQAQQRDQEHKQNQAQERTQQREQKATQQAQDRAKLEERGKAMSQRPSSLTSEQQRTGKNDKNGEQKGSRRVNEERTTQHNQATQNGKQERSPQNAAQNQNKQDRKNTPNGTNAQNAPANRNANQAKENQTPANQAQQGKQDQQRAAQGTNQGTGTTQTTSQNTNQRNTASAKLSQNDRSKVISTLRSDTRGSRENVNVSLSIGERLPPRIHARPLPRTIVDIMPEYRGYDYLMVQDRVDIVDPRTHEVVDIIEEGGPAVAQGGTFESRTFQSGRVRLTAEQRQMLFRDARPMTSSQVSSSGGTCLTEQPVPDALASQNQDLKGYNFLKVGNDIVLIDPKDQKVIDVIQQ